MGGSAMRTCFMLPGILGTEMETPDNPESPGILWFNWGRVLYLREFGGLALAANGRDPHPDYGQRCVPTVPMRVYYGQLEDTLRAQLSPHGYEVIPWGYDWRRSISSQGELLAAAIREKATLADPCSIVAHSQGGLVARYAWVLLGVSGEQGLVRRIVTIGTPHHGSYATCELWSLNDPTIDQLVTGVRGFQFAGINPYWYVWEEGIRARDVERVCATWPSMYQLMPYVDEESERYDPERRRLFFVENWPSDRQLSGLHLSRAFDDWQVLMRSAASMPPINVLTTVGGVGISTPWQLRRDGLIGSPSAYASTSSGDGSVALNSAVRLPGPALVVSGTHQSLPSHPAILDRIGGLVLKEIPAPPPVTAEEDFTVQALPMSGPPLPQALVWMPQEQNCRDGSCAC